MIEKAEDFIAKNEHKPFFLYYASVVPHVALQVPEDSLNEYRDQFDDQPYLGNKGYLPHPYPRAAYAAMITRMDRNIGRIMKQLKDRGLEDNTIVMFSSDNGPTFNGGVDAKFFESAGPLSGLKTSAREGGIRVPMVAKWPGKIEPDSTSDHISAFQDVLPTVCEIVGVDAPKDIDGISFLPTLSNQGDQKKHAYLYWELKQQQALRMGDWKLYRRAGKNGKINEHLFNLKDDLAEQKNLAKSHPEKLNELIKTATAARFDSPLFPTPFDSSN